MSATIKDIARKAGVSHSTVSRALHGSPLISGETASRIVEIAREMGYTASAAARTLKTNRSQVLGVVLPHLDDPFFSEILQGIEDGVGGSGYSLFIAAAHRDSNRESEIVQIMVEHRVDGVIVCSTSFSHETGGELLRFGVPIVVVNNQAAEDFRFSIYHDDFDGSCQATQHVIDLGHRRIAYLGNATSGRTGQDRLNGFQKTAQAAGLPVLKKYIFLAQGGVPQLANDAVRHFLGLSEPPTAIVCFNDMLAIGVLQSLAELGYEVPGDVSVVGFDNIVFSAYTNPPLTTFDQPKRFIGAEAARLLLDLLTCGDEGELADGQNVRILKGKLLVRKSTGMPPGN